MPAYVCQHNLGVHPISELDHSLNPYRDQHIPLVGLGGGQAEPLGFTLMRVQIEGMPHYDEHQVLFILDDPSAFSARIPVILGTPTINRGRTNHERDRDAQCPDGMANGKGHL